MKLKKKKWFQEIKKVFREHNNRIVYDDLVRCITDDKEKDIFHSTAQELKKSIRSYIFECAEDNSKTHKANHPEFVCHLQIENPNADLSERIIKWHECLFCDWLESNGIEKPDEKEFEIAEILKRKNFTSKTLYELPVVDYVEECIKIAYKYEELKILADEIPVIKEFLCFLKSELSDIKINDAEFQITKNASLSELQKIQIIKARKGQGEYRDKLLNKYGRCVITGITTKKILIASHIKPWSACCKEQKYEECIDAENGLLLSPFWDKLFDLGYISFEDDGKMKVSKKLDKITVSEMNKTNENIKLLFELSEKQKYYMKYHRENIYDKKFKK